MASLAKLDRLAKLAKFARLAKFAMLAKFAEFYKFARIGKLAKLAMLAMLPYSLPIYHNILTSNPKLPQSNLYSLPSYPKIPFVTLVQP